MFEDLLWRYHVSKETKQMKVNNGELPLNESAKRLKAQKMKLGITGTLIPDCTPRDDTPVDTSEINQLILSRQRSGLFGH